MGCGVVQYESAADAQLAVTLLNESTLDGRVIKCREDRIIDDDGVSYVNADSDIQNNLQQQEQPEMLQSLQPIAEVQVPMVDVDPSGGGGRPKRVRKPRGNRQQSAPQEDENYSAPPQQFNAVQSVGTSTSPPLAAAGVDGRDQLDPFRVFVTSLAWETTDEDLATFFSTVGEVLSTEVSANLILHIVEKLILSFLVTFPTTYILLHYSVLCLELDLGDEERSQFGPWHCAVFRSFSCSEGSGATA